MYDTKLMEKLAQPMQELGEFIFHFTKTFPYYL